MSSTVFIDTNVLIYAHDADAGEKRIAAAERLEDLWRSRCGVLSPQILQEFYVNATRKLAHPLAPAAARRVVAAYSPWCTAVTAEEVALAFRIEDEARLQFWDALVIASAARAGAALLLSEDLNPGEVIAGVRIENPFPQR